MKAKKLICLLIALSLTVAALAGCKKNSDDPKQTTASAGGTTAKTTSKTTAKTTAKTTTQTTTKSSTQEEPSDTDNEIPTGGEEEPEEMPEYESPVEEVMDLGGMTISLMSWWHDPAAPAAANFFRAVGILEEKYNFKLEVEGLGVNSYAAAANLAIELISGTCDNDIAMTFMKDTFPRLPDNNLILALDDYINALPDELKTTVLGIDTFWKGKNYAFSEFAYNGTGALNLIYYNTEILAREGIEDINDYYVANDKWTWDEFLDVAIKTTKDLNGDGILDQWGFGANPIDFAHGLVYSNGGSYLAVEDDVYVLSLNDHRTISALQFMSDFYNLYKVGRFVSSNPSLGHIPDFAGGRVTMTCGADHVMRLRVLPLNPDPQELMVTFFPKSPNAPELGWTTNLSSGQQFIVLPYVCKNPEAVTRIWAEIKYIVSTFTTEEQRDESWRAGLYTSYATDRMVDWIFNLRKEFQRDPYSPKYNKAFAPLNAFGNLENDMRVNIFNKLPQAAIPVRTAVDTIYQQYESILRQYQGLE